ncbi:ABC-2 type transport system permease protein [Paenibacillus sp. UNCCL117]|uniref:ABC transporter permease n=1 Tax=unclassified Paenibacillus TaxID=185978 RepID=UPI00089279B0|nr:MULTISPECIES: ABC transporter permease [unclassified Paenibacillus]SDB98885.1 ABC-2 type transport system permease protein [Paenibacillus sp. cl123]SFW69024.1 ABC-2 type transport system permease protein [Paenibacillus sp. UNCCL117]
MSSLLSLVQNENMKIYNRLRTWIMMGILIFTVITAGILMKFVLEVPYTNVLQFMGATTYLTGLCTIFSVIVAGDIVASEFSWGTIKLLLIRPASRSKVLASKLIAALLFMLGLLALHFIFSYFTGLILFGMGAPLLPGGESMGNIVRTYLLDTVSIVMTVLLAFMISAAFRSSSLAIGLSIFLLLTKDGVVLILARLKYDWVKYFLFTNTDLTPYVTGGKPPVEGMTLGFSVAVLVAYAVLFYLISWLLFTKRDVAGN